MDLKQKDMSDVTGLIMTTMGVGVANVVKALIHHVKIVPVEVRVSAVEANEKGCWEDPCTEGAPIIWQDLSGRPAI